MYFALNIETSEEAAELVQAVLDATEPLGIEIRDHTLKLPDGAPPLPQGVVQLVAYYEGEIEADEAKRQVHSELPDARVEVVPLRDENWAEAWKRHVRPTRVGRVWVGPEWERQNAGDAPVQIVIDPGMAFGTGDHPTTAMCLAELDEALAKWPGRTVFDVGTGSGVLAIAARKLGAGKVLGNDIDPVAVQIARENAERNNAPDIEFTELPIERIEGEYDLVVANLFSSVLCQLAPRIADRIAPEGKLMCTGILAPQASEVQAAMEREDLRFVGKRACGEWVLLTFERKS